MKIANTRLIDLSIYCINRNTYLKLILKIIQFQDNLSMVNWCRGWVVHWLGGWMVHWLRGWVVGLGFWVGGNTLVLDVSNVAIWTIGVRSVGDNLGATIWKGNSVGARHNLGIRGLASSELGTRVVISNSVLKGIWLGGWLMVWCRGMVRSWGWVVGWSIVCKGSSGQSTGNSVLEHGEGCWEEEGSWEGWDVEAQSCLSALMSHKCVATVYISRQNRQGRV